MITLALAGDKQLIDKLTSMGKKAAPALRKATRTGVKLIAQEVRQAYPKQTGALKRSVKTRALPRKKGSVGHFVRVDQFYAWFLERGTKTGIKPRRFLENAAKKLKQQVHDVVIRTVKTELGAS